MNTALFGIWATMSVTAKLLLAVVVLLIIGTFVFFLIREARITYARIVKPVLDNLENDMFMKHQP